jgi:hypothetical protein
MIAHLFPRYLLKISLACGILLILSVIAFSVFFRPGIPTFAMIPNKTNCHTMLTEKVPGKTMIVPQPKCRSFSIRILSQPYPTAIKVCPQMVAGPILLDLLVNYQEQNCFYWTAKTGEWHTFYRYSKLTDISYPGFLVRFTGPSSHPKYSINAEIQQ